jgi:hypothetical protein
MIFLLKIKRKGIRIKQFISSKELLIEYFFKYWKL